MKQHLVMKKFRVVVRSDIGSVIVHAGEFNPNISDEYVININSNHARKSLVYQEVKRAIDKYEDILLKEFESMPPYLQKKVSKYMPFADQEFRKWLKELRKQVVKTWKI